VIDRDVVDAVLADAWRRTSPIHGEEHWRCVATTGLGLADGLDGADRDVVLLFGLLHDTRRENESVDPGHGPRAVVYTRELAAAGALPLEDARLAQLCHAIELHSNGLVNDDPTVGACWDADRLHLPRVAITPDPARFSTALAHGPEPLAAAARVRDGPPEWDDLLRLL
jgi:uncharacterized protein